MPRGDGTGPKGYGPMTGRGAGRCAGYAVPGFMNPVPGRGFGGRGGGFWGRGGGRGWRHWFYATGLPGWARGGWNQPLTSWGLPAQGPTPEQELELLQEQAKHFDQALEEVRKRIDELSAERNA